MSNIKALSYLLIAMFCINTSYAEQTEPVKFLKKEKVKRCTNPATEEIAYKNISERDIKLRLCVKKSGNGKWSCISNSALQPGQTMTHFSCSGISDHRYWWGEVGSKSIYPKPDQQPSGRFWTDTAECKNKNLNFYTEEPHPALMKVVISNGAKLNYAKKRQKNSEGQTVYTVDKQYLYGLICGAGNTKEGSWIHRMKGEMRDKTIQSCIKNGGKKSDCKKTGKSPGMGVRG